MDSVIGKHAYDFEIIVASEKDLNDILELNKQFHLDIDDFEWDKSEWIKEEIKKGNYFILRYDGRILGAIDIKKIGNSEQYIEAIAVDPNQHGSGFGKRLIMFARDEAQKMGCKKLTIESFQSYEIQDFYKKVGFELDRPPVGYHDGKPFHRFVMFLPN